MKQKMTPDQVITPPTPPTNIGWGFNMSNQAQPSINEGVKLTPPSNGFSLKETWEKDFWSYTNNQQSNSIVKKLSMSITEGVMWITFFVFIWSIFLWLAKINIWGDEKNTDYWTTVQTYKDLVTNVDTTTWYPWINENKVLIDSITNENLNKIIKSTIPFIFKRDILEEAVSKIIKSILEKNNILQSINKDINKYWFIHPDVMSILEKNKEQIPIMVSLHTLETIKFWTALKIFSMLDTFLQQASSSLWISKNELADTMTKYTERWEKDIANYLSTCYLNPYERLPNCDQVNDFNNYFSYEDKDTKINTNLFSKIFNLIDTKLEKIDISSLQIDFNRFDPNVKNIWFRVTVNTVSEDDNAFIARGIINPHVFIISTLVTLLKQSAFVIWDSINVDKLNIKQQNINVWNIQIPVNTSFMTFDLPLQNSSEREIFDFYNNL